MVKWRVAVGPRLNGDCFSALSAGSPKCTRGMERGGWMMNEEDGGCPSSAILRKSALSAGKHKPGGGVEQG